jgi:hypothetical protein
MWRFTDEARDFARQIQSNLGLEPTRFSTTTSG